MEYRILGALRVYDNGAEVAVRSGRDAALLALLLLHANEAVSSGELVDQLWEEPPSSAAKILQNCVSRLRRDLGDGVLVTRRHGYELRVEAGELDADRFAEGLEAGRRALAAGDAKDAASSLGDALALWRGPALADFAYERFARAEIDRLEELRLAALTERIEAELALGRHADVIGELEVLVARHPLDERLCGQLMLALYRSGRQAEALQRYQAQRRVLVEQLGIEPGRQLRALELEILNQDPSLERPEAAPREVAAAPSAASPRPSRRQLVRAGLVAAAALAAAAAGLAVAGRHTVTRAVAPGNSVAIVDPATNEVVDRIGVGNLPGPITAGGGRIWVVNTGDGTVARLSGRTGTLQRTLPLTEGNHVGVTAIAFGSGAAWAGDGFAGAVTPISLLSGPAAPARVDVVVSGDKLLLAAGRGSVWVVSTRLGELTRLDAGTLERVAELPVAPTPVGIAADSSGVWLVSVGRSRASGVLTRIDPATGTVAWRLPLPFAPSAVAVGFDSVWVAVNSQDEILRIDPRTRSVTKTIDVGQGPIALAVGEGAVWVANARSETLSRIDPRTNTPATIPLAGTPQGIATGGGRVWVTGA
ncbi:MAG TPA: BTAD domain-containing putative transcriptional regulator [Gaiellaceae bacterium]|nr:BTAD domain-containing putative transcriptional regulator [Gaiellaceae bacterium]